MKTCYKSNLQFLLAGRANLQSALLRDVYVTCVGSVLLYAAPAFYPKLNDEGKNALLQIQYAAARLIIAARGSPNREATLCEAGIIELSDLLTAECAVTIAKARARPPAGPLRIAVEHGNALRYTPESWLCRGQWIIDASAVAECRVEEELATSRRQHPAILEMLERGRAQISLREATEKDVQLALENYEEVWFTDGSVASFRFAIGVVGLTPNGAALAAFPCGKFHDAYDAERDAILNVLARAIERPPPEPRPLYRFVKQPAVLCESKAERPARTTTTNANGEAGRARHSCAPRLD